MKSFKFYSLIALIACISFGYLGCKKQTDLDLSGTYILKSGQSLSIPTNRNLASLTAAELTDSRCPANAICVWEGIGTGKFIFKDNTKEQTIELCIGACAVVSKPKTPEIILNSITYTVELTSLNPFPGTGTANETVKATILLKKK